MKKPLFQWGSILSALMGLILLCKSPVLGLHSADALVNGAMDTSQYLALLQNYTLAYMIIGVILMAMGLAGVLTSLYLFGPGTAKALKHLLWNKPSWYFSFFLALAVILWMILSLLFPGDAVQAGMIVAGMLAFGEAVIDWNRRRKFSYMYLVAAVIFILAIFV
ncbi:MAG TPA: hypothetical protein VFK33_01610 [Bacillales bacterium]|nr:hypothetical protein [Bacillales bacterium]